MSRELDAQIAEKVMGWKWLYHPATHRRALRGDWQHWRLEVFEPGVDVLTEPDDLEDVPHYSTNLNLCALAEARVVEMGLGEQYGRELMIAALLEFQEDAPLIREAIETSLRNGAELTANGKRAMSLATTPAETRCRALLSALEAQP